MERPPYNLCGGQNRVQIIITSTRETPLFSLGKNTQKNKEFEHNRCKEYCMYVLVWEYLKKKSIEDEPSPLFFEFLYRRNRSQRRTRWLPSTCEGETRNARKVGSCVLPTPFPGRRAVRARRTRLKRQNVETNLRLVRCPNEAIWKERT